MVSSKTNDKSKGLLKKGFNAEKLLPSLSQFDKPDMAALQKVAQYLALMASSALSSWVFMLIDGRNGNMYEMGRTGDDGLRIA